MKKPKLSPDLVLVSDVIPSEKEKPGDRPSSRGMESAAPVVLGHVRDTDVVHIAPGHPGTLLSHLLLLLWG